MQWIVSRVWNKWGNRWQEKLLIQQAVEFRNYYTAMMWLHVDMFKTLNGMDWYAIKFDLLTSNRGKAIIGQHLKYQKIEIKSDIQASIED